MGKRVFRYFWLFMTSQEQWLNKMAADGYRLTGTTTAHYEFEECEKEKYQYSVVYVANDSKEHVEEYVRSLEACGYRVLYKNLNLNYSTGKIEMRPFAEEGGRVATRGTTLYKELLIVEKENDGTDFKLCPTYEQRYNSYKKLQLWGILGVFAAAALGMIGKNPVWGVMEVISFVWVVLFWIEIRKLKRTRKESE